MFQLIKIDNARMNVPEPEYYECGEEIKCGQALYLLESLKLASKDDPKEFIAMADGKEGAIIPVCRICKEQVWETRLESDERVWHQIKPGAVITVDKDGVDSFVINGENSDATVVSKSEPDHFTGSGAPDGGYIRIRFLCNFGKDASNSKPES